MQTCLTPSTVNITLSKNLPTNPDLGTVNLTPVTPDDGKYVVWDGKAWTVGSAPMSRFEEFEYLEEELHNENE